MSEDQSITDPTLGVLARAVTELPDGPALTHDWYSGRVNVDGADVDLVIEGASAEGVTALLPYTRQALTALPTLRRLATDAVVTQFSAEEPKPQELQEAHADLALETLQTCADGTVVLHFTDTCGEHFLDGYWPAVRIGTDGQISDVTVEA
ncbi:hypothetical protein [Kineosporia babensis]|uniref:Uncharacterized protein n=1 Tax=Kineosporia babensis TaxID=499548 RepID=A0A9X1N9S7_9ACTN|nr:hypothetical protein [Kineosporia babensis]MCD5311002.1 hypothetical protein [Kineosporia babensis]